MEATTSRIPLRRIIFEKSSRIIDPSKKCRGNLIANIEAASLHLRKFAIPLEEGPYSDMEGAVGRLCGLICERSGSRMEYVERVANAVIDKSAFSLSDSIVLSQTLTTAGSILADESRAGHISLSFTHILEPYMLATSLLRRNGFECYPALAIIGHGEFDPVLAIMGMDDSPFAVLSLSEIPPPMHTLELISDMAMLGLTHAMAAENTARLLARRTIAMMQIEGDYPSEEEVHLRVAQMGDSLFECGIHWPRSPFIGRALDFLKSKMTRTYSLLAAASLNAHAEEIPQHLVEDQIQMFSRGAFYLASGLEVMVKDHMQHRGLMHSISDVN